MHSLEQLMFYLVGQSKKKIYVEQINAIREMKNRNLFIYILSVLLVVSPEAFAQDSDKNKVQYVVIGAHLDTEFLWTLKESINEYIPATLDNNFSVFMEPQQSFMAIRETGFHHYALLRFPATGELKIEVFHLPDMEGSESLIDSFVIQPRN